MICYISSFIQYHKYSLMTNILKTSFYWHFRNNMRSIIIVDYL